MTKPIKSRIALSNDLVFNNNILYYNINICIITQVIIEILVVSLAENGVIFRYNHLHRGDYSRRSNFQNNRLSLCQCVQRENSFNERKCHSEEYKTRHKIRNDTL